MRRIWSKLSCGFVSPPESDEIVNKAIKTFLQLQRLTKGGPEETKLHLGII